MAINEARRARRDRMYRAIGFRHKSVEPGSRPRCPLCGVEHPGVRDVVELGVSILEFFGPWGHRGANGEPCRGVPWHEIPLPDD